MKAKDEVKQAMIDVIEELISVKLSLSEINKSEQFDYVTDSKLSSLSDDMIRLSKEIDNAIYQR